MRIAAIATIRSLICFVSLGLAGCCALAQSDSTPTLHQAPMVERYGKPYVMVTVNGKGPFRFVIDTGTGVFD